MLVEAVVRNGASFNCWDSWMQYGPHLTILTSTLMVLTNLVIIGQDWLLFFAVNPHTGDLYATAHFQKEAIPCYVFLFCRPSLVAWHRIGVLRDGPVSRTAENGGAGRSSARKLWRFVLACRLVLIWAATLLELPFFPIATGLFPEVLGYHVIAAMARF